VPSAASAASKVGQWATRGGFHTEALWAEEAVLEQEIKARRHATERLSEYQGEGRAAVARVVALADQRTKDFLNRSSLGNHPELGRRSLAARSSASSAVAGPGATRCVPSMPAAPSSLPRGDVILMDHLTTFSDRQAVTVSAASTDVLDFGPADPNTGRGERMYVVVRVVRRWPPPVLPP
jgi:hypothetical protein